MREHHRQAEAVQRVQREEDHRSGHQDPEEGHQCQEEDHRGQAAVRQGQEEDHQGQGEDREEGRIARALWLASLPPCRALKSFAREERTLLRELTHRISNELVSSISIVSAAAVRADNPEVKVALSNVVDLLQQHADLHRALTIPNRNGLVDAAEYIRKLGLAMSRCCLEPIGIRLALITDTLPLESEKCWRLALAVHELVANAARHACFDGRDGEIKVKLSLADSVVNCIIADNGSLSRRLKPAQGLQIVRDLTKSLGGRIEYGFGAQFSSFLLVFPLTERERRANRAVASRCARGMRQRNAMPPLSRSEPARQPLDATDGISQQSRAS